MIRVSARNSLVLALLWCFAGLSQRDGLSQTNGAKTVPPHFLFPVSLEWNEALNPVARDKLTTEGFKIEGGTKSLKMKFSTQAPGILGGKQFQWMPGGYQLYEFSLSRKWGSIQGFRSLRYNSRIVPSEYARTITGAGIEVPKFLLKTRLSADFLQVSPSTEARRAHADTLVGSAGTQIGFTLARELKKGARFQLEWTQAQHDFRAAPAVTPSRSFGGARRGLMMKFEGVLARTDLASTFTARNEGLANPAAPAYGPGNHNFRIDARRKVKGHQLQYSAQLDEQKAVPLWGFPTGVLREHIAGWSYASKRLPQLSASLTRRSRTTAGRQEEENGGQLAAAKSVRRVNASVTMVYAQGTDGRSPMPMWRRTMLAGDATIGMWKGRQLHARYESSTIRQSTFLEELDVSSLQLDTRVALWRDQLTLAPALDIRRQGGSTTAFSQSAARLGLSAQIRVPHRIPGTDLVVNFAAHRVQSTGQPGWKHVDLTIRWNFKRF